MWNNRNHFDWVRLSSHSNFLVILWGCALCISPPFCLSHISLYLFPFVYPSYRCMTSAYRTWMGITVYDVTLSWVSPDQKHYLRCTLYHCFMFYQNWNVILSQHIVIRICVSYHIFNLIYICLMSTISWKIEYPKEFHSFPQHISCTVLFLASLVISNERSGNGRVLPHTATPHHISRPDRTYSFKYLSIIFH